MQVQSNSPAVRTSSRRTLRQRLNIVLPLLGAGIIVSMAFFKPELQDAVLIVLGVLLIEVGIMKMSHKLLPDQRKYFALRAHTDQFIVLVRQLNAAALRLKEHDTPEHRRAIEKIRQHMQQMIDRLVATAGKTDAELAAEATQAPQEELAAS